MPQFVVTAIGHLEVSDPAFSDWPTAVPDRPRPPRRGLRVRRPLVPRPLPQV